MFETPEHKLATVAVAGLGVALIVYFWRWFFAGPLTPDPWDETVSAQIESANATPLCHRCVTTHAVHEHFCPNCGVAVGDYNNLLPFERLFSEGEVFRNGTAQGLRPTFLVVSGYLLMSTAAYAVFAPLYWFLLLRNLNRQADPPFSEAELPPVAPYK